MFMLAHALSSFSIVCKCSKSLINSNEKAKEELASWGLALSPNMHGTDDRQETIRENSLQRQLH